MGSGEIKLLLLSKKIWWKDWNLKLHISLFYAWSSKKEIKIFSLYSMAIKYFFNIMSNVFTLNFLYIILYFCPETFIISCWSYHSWEAYFMDIFFGWMKLWRIHLLQWFILKFSIWQQFSMFHIKWRFTLDHVW